ncbi:hypothetical protein QEH46_gp27 [Rothia phage Spartoi]|uniref:Holin n=1 Tax=Rothia phage Spartoi TaxID=2483661 RepID=A0A5K7NIU0_9CAUD|nr:hypothetical protein QEH46_gp27 [Rothia phage Spartoi]AZF88211.1 hypothetical protein SEA_SPARTOI_27 [Rothia phage Spartoi]
MNETRYVGGVTKGATIGTAIASSIVVLIAYGLELADIRLPEEIKNTLFILLSAVGALIGGRQSPGDALTFSDAMEAAARGVVGDSKNEPAPIEPESGDSRAAFEEYRNSGKLSALTPAEQPKHEDVDATRFESNPPGQRSKDEVYIPGIGWVVPAEDYPKTSTPDAPQQP